MRRLEGRLVTREWLYTAITQARESVILIAQPGAIEAAIERRTERVTGFVLD
jgi:exodeoxyribonuclease V alpha subunit